MSEGARMRKQERKQVEMDPHFPGQVAQEFEVQAWRSEL